MCTHPKTYAAATAATAAAAAVCVLSCVCKAACMCVCGYVYSQFSRVYRHESMCAFITLKKGIINKQKKPKSVLVGFDVDCITI